MTKKQRLKKQFNNFMYDHYLLQIISSYSKGTFLALFGAALYAFCFCAFITPGDADGLTIVTGGVGGISQNIWLISKMCGANLSPQSVQSVMFSVLNIPLLILSFFCVGKRFTILTLINVLFSSLFITFFSNSGFAKSIAESPILKTSTISRTIFAGAGIGFSSALTFKAEASSGGIDIVSYYLSIKKSTGAGKYGLILNSIIVTTYFVLSSISNPNKWADALIGVCFSIIYIVVNSLVIDLINVRNKKILIQCITERADMSKILIAYFPHSTTNVPAKGGFAGKDKTILYMVTSSIESNKVISVMRKADPKSFIAVTPLRQVYGSFFIKPVE